MPDVPAGPILASEVGGPKCKIWDAIGSDLLAGGAGGARLAGPRIGSGTTWPRAVHQATKCALPSPKIEPFLGGATSALGIKFPSFHAEKRAVLAQGACSTELLMLGWQHRAPTWQPSRQPNLLCADRPRERPSANEEVMQRSPR